MQKETYHENEENELYKIRDVPNRLSSMMGQFEHFLGNPRISQNAAMLLSWYNAIVHIWYNTCTYFEHEHIYIYFA